ncbi:MAG TPA: aromatic amino acid lyase, partial [Candidatus Izemoplasmatales bacterium]|nr:aromatic amino acid lyase [Candidatus Izemoplasmatales bacterium]
MKYINGSNLDLQTYIKIVVEKEKVGVKQNTIDQVDKACQYVEKVVESGVPTYGINTGFGQLSKVSIGKEDANKLQENLIKSHACGVGEPLDDIYVRGMILLRINALIKGYSGIRFKVIQKMIEFLNHDLTPIVYAKGSLGASGDLAPLAHMALPIIGLGELRYQGKTYPAKIGLKNAGIQPIDGLVSKEGLALINGTQAITAIAAYNLYQALNLFNLSVHTLGITMEALRGIIDVFDEDIHRLRNQTGQQFVAKRMRDILSDSKLMTHQGELRIQDAYSLRCSPQVLGASLDAINYAYDVV